MDGFRDEQFDELGLELPFQERADEQEAGFSSALQFGEETFVTLPPAGLASGAGLSSLEAAISEAETEAAASSETEWLEAEWLETPAAPPAESIESFAERLGRQWSERRGGNPAVEAMRAWLIEDHEATLLGAQQRWKKLSGSPDFRLQVSKAWMVSREENMRFQTEPGQGIASLGLFAPPAAEAGLVTEPLVRDSDKAPIAPLTARFARRLKSIFPGVQMSNYQGHGGGTFLNRGYSLDLFLQGRDPRGFYPPEQAKKLLRAVDKASAAVGARWRVLYNDFEVADTINREFRRRHIFFIGSVQRNRSKRVTGLNWHGPHPLILHFHLDLAPLASAELGEAEQQEFENRSEHRCEACAGRHEMGVSETRADEVQEQLGEGGRQNEWSGEWSGEQAGETAGSYEMMKDLEQEANALESAGLSPAERRALEITSTLETGQRGGFYGLSGNFDGMGLSFGLVNWTIGTGSLQPLLRDFATEQPARWASVFGPKATQFREVIMPKGRAAEREQLRFAIEEMNERTTVRGRTRWAIRQPWRDCFKRLSEDPEFRRIQIRYVRDLLGRAAYYCRLFGLKSERAYAFMFDAVSSHGKWWLTKKYQGGIEKRRLMIEERLRASGGVANSSERDILLTIADVLAETSSPRWADNVRSRKHWFVTGEHRRARELTGLQPSDSVPWTVSAGTVVREDREELAWLDLESGSPQMEQEELEPGPGEHEQYEGVGYRSFDELENAFGGETAAAWQERPLVRAPGAAFTPGGEPEIPGHLEAGAFGEAAASWTGAGETINSEFDTEDEGGEAFGEGPFQTLLNADEALAEEIYLTEDAGFSNEAFDCSAPLGQPNLECEFPGQKKLIAAGNQKGLLLTRSVNNPRTDLSLQFADYDINATLPHKEAHNNGVAQVTSFIIERVRDSKADVVVHLSGSASRTDQASYNRRLSCQRARCLASAIQVGLGPFTLGKTRFVIDDRGFDEAVCRTSPTGRGENCELGEFRSVRVTVTSQGGKVIPVPINPRHDQFEIRVCRFETQALAEVALNKILEQRPAGMPREVAELLGKILKSRIMKLLKLKAPLLSRALGNISSAIEWIPIQFTKQSATFQIRERNKRETPGRKTEIRSITLCYEGWGGRLAIPYDVLVMEGIDRMLDKFKALERIPGAKALFRDFLKAILNPVLTKRLRLIASETPGNWKPFITKKPMLIEGFAGPADVMIDMLSSMVDPGTIHLGLNGYEFNSKTNPSYNVLMCGDCSGPVIPLIVTGGGFDIWSVSTGKMASKDCICVAPQGEQLAEFA